jgi:hypothetical protein
LSQFSRNGSYGQVLAFSFANCADRVRIRVQVRVRVRVWVRVRFYPACQLRISTSVTLHKHVSGRRTSHALTLWCFLWDGDAYVL